MFSGPQDSSAPLPFSQPAVCADVPVAASSGGAPAAAVLGRDGKKAGKRRCFQAVGMGGEVFTGVWGLLEEGAWRLYM